MVNYFDDDENRHWPERALQLWQILIGKAHNQQLVTYGELRDILGFGGAGVFAQPLGHIAYYCDREDLPPLTTVVIKEDTGEPGDGIPVKNIHKNRMKVFAYDWYRMIPPTPDEFEEAWERGGA